MKTKILLQFLIYTLLSNAVLSQVLPIKLVTQEQNQWCWVGTSKCILDYYDHSVQQCEIAEYTRTVASWHSFGTQGCCSNPSGACNYWNYNWGQTGSIQDILVHFADIQNSGMGALNQSQVQTQIDNWRPFIIRWGWTTGGGHFIVGHGISEGMLYYMDPWFGEGHMIATFDWVGANADHTWTHTNVISTDPRVLSISNNSLSIASAVNSSNSFDIISNIDWTASSNQTWLSISNTGSFGNKTITLTALANPSVSRVATITISGANVTAKTVTVTQLAGATNVPVNEIKDDFEVYPNPSRGKFTIDLRNCYRMNVTISITNSIGTLVKEINLLSLPENYEQEVDLSGMVSGIYFIAIQTSKLKIIKSVVLLTD